VEEAIIENLPDEIKYAGPEAIRNNVNDYVASI
jgi:hypothetical protein